MSGAGQTATEKGVAEILTKIRKEDTGYYLREVGTTDRIDSKPANLSTGNWEIASYQSLEKLHQQIKGIFNTYHQAINNAMSIDDEIHAIAQCIHDVEILHPFLDGNCRTIVVLLMTKLLLERGLSPAILENPNRFDAYAVDELCVEIKNGMNLFNSYKENKTDNLPNGMKEDVIVYVNQNQAIAKIIAQEALSQCAHWSELSADTQKVTLNLVIDALCSTDGLNELNKTQLSAVKTTITAQVNAAIYKKSNSTPSLFRTAEKPYGVFFNKGVASYIYNNKNALDVNKLKNELRNSRACYRIHEANIKAG